MINYDPKRWWLVLLSFPRSPVFTTLLLDVIGVGIYAGLVVWVQERLGFEAPLGPQILSLLGIILGLLLVFRTNTAYDRWWEGRRLLGQLTNVSRALARQLDAMLPGQARERRDTYAELLAAWPVALTQRLRGNGLREPGRLSSELVCALQGDIRQGALPREALISLTPMMAAFDDIQGGCERILKTPIPFSYSSYVKQFVLFFALLAPFALADEFGYGTIIAEMFIFFSTMGLELLAGEVEEPFGQDRNDLPVDDIATGIALDVRWILGAKGSESRVQG
ncbi:MAG: putative rane protein [Gemmatimonadetes bacterium]|jgi:putative membrane protein|nr:putative rane protein [Gemmatimonadota bacterium]